MDKRTLTDIEWLHITEYLVKQNFNILRLHKRKNRIFHTEILKFLELNIYIYICFAYYTQLNLSRNHHFKIHSNRKII